MRTTRVSQVGASQKGGAFIIKKSTWYSRFSAVMLGIVLCLCMMVLPAEAQTPVELLFELDGNMIDQSAIGDPDDESPPDDWAWGNDTGSWDYVAGPDINGNPPGGSAHLSSFVNDPNGDTGVDDIFTGGGSKDDLPIKAGWEKANGWAWTYGTAPDKDDLLGVGAAAYIPELGELLIYDFGTLYAANGTSSIGNWFFKKNIGPCVGGPHDGKFGVVDPNDPNRACLDDQPEGPLHSIGDVLIISENTNGGTVTNISVYKWVAGDDSECAGKDPNWSFVPPKNNLCLIGEFAGATCDGNIATNPYACGVMNQISSESPDTYGFLSKFPPANGPASPAGTDGIQSDDYPAFSLLEAGLNISQILEDTECFSSFLKNTRTSASPRSQLKDFAGGSFELCGIALTKACDALLNAAGDQVDVMFGGEVTNTGVVALEIDLADSVAGSEITAVCYDINGSPGECDASDDVPGDLTPLPDGSATFTLGPGETVLYEGNYAFTGQLTTLEFTDTMMATAYLGDVEVDSAEADATCTTPVIVDIEVTKFCDPYYENGDTFRAEITGGATNAGNVKLVNVQLTDNVFLPGDLTIVHDTNGDGIVDSGEPPFDGSLLPGKKLAYKATFISTSAMSHSNTATAYGENVFDTNQYDQETASTSGDQCRIDTDPDLEITKVCDESINGTGVRLVDMGDYVAVEVGNVITVTNSGDEVLNPVQVSDSETDLSTAATDWSCTGGVCSGPLAVGDSITFTQTYYPDGDNIIGALLNPGSVYFKNTATAAGVGVLSKESVGPKQADAECKICPPCPTCN